MNWNYDNPDPHPPAIVKHEINHLEGGVLVPGLQALLTGFVCGLAALAVTAWFGLPWLAIGGTVFAVTMAGAWLSYRGRWQWLLERILGADLNGDGTIGQPLPLPAPKPENIRIELVQNAGHEVEYIDLPFPEKLPLLASGLLEGKRQFSLTAWTGDGQLFSRAEFETLRTELLKRKLAEWKNPEAPAQGIKLTPAGRAIFRRLAGRHDSPTLPGYGQ